LAEMKEFGRLYYRAWQPQHERQHGR